MDLNEREERRHLAAAEGAPKAIGPYSVGVRNAGMMFVSGQLPIDAESGKMPETAGEQTRQSLRNVAAVLKEGGLDLRHVVKTTVFVTDLGDFAEVNAAYGEFFSSDFPSRSCVEVSALPKGASVEIEVIAMA